MLVPITNSELVLNSETLEISRDGSLLNPGPGRNVDNREIVVQVHLTDACNLRCSYCFVPHSAARMQPDDVHKVAAFINSVSLRYSRTHVNFFGGEPTLEFDSLRRCVELLRNREHVHLVLSTNGTLLDEEQIAYLRDNGFSVCVSVDGPEELHDLHRRTASGAGTFVLVLRAIEKLQAAGIPLSLEAVVNLDHPELVAQFEYLRNAGVSYFQLSPNYFHGPLTEERVQALTDQLHRVSALYYDDLGERGKDCYSFCVGHFFGSLVLLAIHNRWRQTSRCDSGRIGCAISSRGGFFPCSPLVGQTAYRTGSLVHWPRNLARPALSAAECGQCWARYLCGGPCRFVQSLTPGGGLDGGLCQICRNGFMSALELYVKVAASDWEVLAYFERK